mmetsp:Transcript_17852/g.32375  ORF Transcript_17852/g.32375 Transcript_17852/m.32375 type:complete len:350 (-) Transcript_17852:43-1092(-)
MADGIMDIMDQEKRATDPAEKERLRIAVREEQICANRNVGRKYEEVVAMHPGDAEWLRLCKELFRIREEPEADESAEVRLEEAFASSSSPLITVQGGSLSGLEVVFFDMDGVLTKECSYFERAWALLIRQLLSLDPAATLDDLSDEDLEAGLAFRKRTKGGLPAARIQLLLSQREALHPSEPSCTVDDCRKVFYDAVQLQQTREWGSDWEAYLLPGARELLAHLQPHCRVVLVTANEQPQAEWVTKQADIAKYFHEVIGYPIAVDADVEVTKATLMTKVLQATGVSPDRAAFIGDGVSDVRFGQQVKVWTIGVANDLANGKALVAHKPNFLVCRTADLLPHVDSLLGLS